MSSLPASINRIRSKASEKRQRHHFPHYKSKGLSVAMDTRVLIQSASKPLKNLLLQNQRANDIVAWYVALGPWAIIVCSNDDPKLTLTYFFTARSNLVSKLLESHLMEETYSK